MDLSSVSINIKWGRMTFNDIKINLPPSTDLFQAQVFSLTGVPPERQKLLYKGSQIKDFDNFTITEGMLLYLIGSGTVKASEDTSVEPSFIEKLPVEPCAGDALPPILLNLGNTCYLNATVQFLRCIIELRDVLNKYKESKGGAEDSYLIAYSLSGALRDLFRDLDNAPIDGVVSPVNLLHVLQLVAPNFCERDKNGSLMQQDANECLSVIIKMLQSELPPVLDSKKNKHSFIDQYLTGKYNVTTKCIDSDEYTEVSEEFLQLSCFISQEVKFMSTGVQLNLEETINKFSDNLKRETTYKRTYEISRLPAYLIVNFLRFYYKEKVKTNAKILKEVKFPLIFDVYRFCSEELKKELAPMRDNFRSEEEYSAHNKPDESETTKYDTYPDSFDYDLGSNNSGYYQLKAIITHKGRTSQAGHYIAWVKIQDSKKNLWAKVDDDIRYSNITEEDILKLAGGSDNHIAYLLLYGPYILKKHKPRD